LRKHVWQAEIWLLQVSSRWKLQRRDKGDGQCETQPWTWNGNGHKKFI